MEKTIIILILRYVTDASGLFLVSYRSSSFHFFFTTYKWSLDPFFTVLFCYNFLGIQLSLLIFRIFWYSNLFFFVFSFSLFYLTFWCCDLSPQFDFTIKTKDIFKLNDVIFLNMLDWISFLHNIPLSCVISLYCEPLIHIFHRIIFEFYTCWVKG